MFYGSHALWIHYRKRTEQAVLDAWREYHDHLSAGAQDGAQAVWSARNDELFVNLLFAIAKDVRYRFDRVQLKKGAYSPQAHGEMLLEQSLIRRMSVELT